MTCGRFATRRVVAAASLLLALPAAARAEARQPCARVSVGVSRWTAPLNRPITVRLENVSLRAALDRLAADGSLHLSYSAELLPLDRQVCVTGDAVPLGDAFAAVLRGTAIEAVVVGADQVALTPIHLSGGTTEPAIARGVGVLDRVVVTGSAVASTQRPLTVGLDVVDGPALQRRNATTVAEALDASVPGIWVWTQSPSSLLASYASVRGASSFGVSYPKMYIDGIEVANPLLVAQFDPQMVDRVEVIRGPQGAALYGSDAISGVVNVVTSHAPADPNGYHTEVGSSVGAAQSEFASHPPVVQDYALSLRGGSALNSRNLSVRFGTMGDYAPNAYSQSLSAHGGVRMIGSRASFVGTARLFGQDAGLARSPFLPRPSVSVSPQGNRAERNRVGTFAPHMDSVVGEAADSADPQSVREYTLGGTGTVLEGAHWAHSVVAGVDGYRLTNVVFENGPIPSAADSALRAARGGADRGTMRFTSVGSFGDDEHRHATITLGVEHALLRSETGGTVYDPDRMYHAQLSAVRWQSNTGVLGQLDASFRNSVFVTSGLRFERNDAFSGDRINVLPLFGTAVVRDVGDVTVKLRAAYGRGIRSPVTPMRALQSLGSMRFASLTNLAPEEQSGTEAGVDVFVGRMLRVQATRFDQRASGLVQQIVWVDSSSGTSRLMYDLQNVGGIANRGWELKGSAGDGPLTLGASFSLVSSRVMRLATGYTGDLRPGDQMLGVPQRTLGVNAAWSLGPWTVGADGSQAWHWTDYDRLAISRAIAAGSEPMQSFAGDELRAFWRNYDGRLRLRGTVMRDLPRGFALTLSGSNLLNYQTGEPDDLAVVPGRTITAGLKARF